MALIRIISDDDDGNYDDDHRKHRVKHCSILVLLTHVSKTAVTL